MARVAGLLPSGHSTHPAKISLALVSLGIGALLAPLITVMDTSPARASTPQLIAVEGGLVTDYNGYRYHLFTHTGGLGESTPYTLTIEGASIAADVLVVAGGGGGGRNRAGGGGAGGLIRDDDPITLNPGDFTVTVGAGGKGGSTPVDVNGNQQWKDNEASAGCAGQDSSFVQNTGSGPVTIVATGGGGGGANASSPTWVPCEDGKPAATGPDGGAGGSGGGGSYPGGKGGAATGGQGHPGGDGSSTNGGGGGGAGGPGTNAASNANGDGGIGRTSAVLTDMGIATGTGQMTAGNDVYFAGGGGGFRNGAAGLGGGGRHGQSGTPSTGGGGGGCNTTDCDGGSPGGSGVVILRYAVPHFTAQTDPHQLTTALFQEVDFGEGLDPIGLKNAASVEVVGALPPGIELVGINDEDEENPVVEFSGTASETGEFTFTLRAYQTDSTHSVVTERDVTVEVKAVAPGEPTGVSVFDQEGATMVALTVPSNPGSNNVTYEATTDGGDTWTTLVFVGSYWQFPDFDQTKQQTIQVRARNTAGVSGASDPIVFPEFMFNNGLFRVGGDGHNNTLTDYDRVASIGPNGQIVQPFYFDGRRNRWAKMTYSDAPFDFALGFGTGNEPDPGSPYDPARNWTGATVYGTFQSSDPFSSPLSGSASVTAENFECVFTETVCVGSGTLISSASFDLDGQTVVIVNRYTLRSDSRFLQVETSVENPGNDPLPNVHVWVGTLDDWVGIRNSGGDGPQASFGGRYRADLPQKFRGTIEDGTFQELNTAAERASALVLESLDGAGLFFSTSPNVNATVAPCCESLKSLAEFPSSSTGTNSSRGFENAVVLNPASSAISTPVDSSEFLPNNPDGEFGQTRRTDLRDAGYALILPLGTIPAAESNSAIWFLGGTAFEDKDQLFDTVSEVAPYSPSVSVGRGTLTVDLASVPVPAGTIGYEVRLRQDDGATVDTAQVFGSPSDHTFTTVANGVSYQVDVAPLTGSIESPTVGERSLLSSAVTPDPPLNTSLPTISGVVVAGATLDTSEGTWEWEGDELTTSYQWQRNGTDIVGANEPSYTIPDNVGSGAFTVVVTVSIPGGVPVEATSDPVTFDPDANLIVEEDFTSALSDEWVLTGSAQVTGDSLRLTPATNNKPGAAFYNIPQQTDGGIDAVFTINQRDNSPPSGQGDGMTFFLKDGSNNSTTPGAVGSRLGFGTGGTTPGISGALIGIGFDRFGGFRRASNSVNREGFTCPLGLGGLDGQGLNTSSPNNLTLRGPGDGVNGYCKLTEAVTIGGNGWQNTPRTIRFRYDPQATDTNQVRIWVDNIDDDDMPLISVAAPQELRDVTTFKFGFTASTGGANNIHEVTSLRVEAANALLPLQPAPSPQLPEARVNQDFSADLTNLFRGGVAPFSLSVTGGDLPPGLSLNSPLAGIPTTPGLYEFTVRAQDSRPGSFQGEVELPVSVRVDAGQTIVFPDIAARQLNTTVVNTGVQTRLEGDGDLPGLAPTFTSSTSDVCTVSSEGSISLLSRGECRITAGQPGGTKDSFEVLAATDVERSFTVFDAALSSLGISSGSLAPAFNPTANQYSVSVPNSVSSVTLTPTARFSGATIEVGGSPLSAGATSGIIPLNVGPNSLVVAVADGQFSRSITVTINRSAAAVTAPGATPRPQVTPPIPGVFTIPQTPAVTSPRPTPSITPASPPVASGPVVTGGQPPRPSSQATATIGGVPQPVTQAPVGTTGVRITTGTLDVGVRVATPGAGTVQTTPEGTPQLAVTKGQSTLISGSGVAPGSTLQVFMPLDGVNAIALGRIQADTSGAFTGNAVLNIPITQAPLPIGPQVLQILGVDQDGNQTVVNMTINIAQPPPQPEINREDQEVPALGVGQSLATEAGIPVPVTVTPVPENNQTLIEGDGWTMGISVAGEGAEVEQTADGDVVLKLVRDEAASVSGSGFMPLTRADVWLFSEPTLLGTVDIDENGEFNGVVNVDGNVVTVGEHTLQLQGVGQDGYVRAANLGVVVGENPELVPEPTATASLSWLLWAIALLALVAIIALFRWLRKASLEQP